MSKSIALYNLYVGEKRPSKEFAEVDFGDFIITIGQDYEEIVGQLPKGESKTTTFEVESDEDGGHMVEKNTFNKKKKGGWVITANLEVSNDKCFSILSEDRVMDGGVWDICCILTFITGRRVATEEHLEAFNPELYGDRACVFIETLWAAKLAWENRGALIDLNMASALHSYNGGLDNSFLNIKAYLFNCSLNVLIDRIPYGIPKLDKKIKDQLRAEIENAVRIFLSRNAGQHQLPSDTVDSYVASIGLAISNGPYSLTDKMFFLFKSMGIIEDGLDADAIKRIKSINKIRNGMVHSGEFRYDIHRDPEIVRRLTDVIVCIRDRLI